jgi:hypothetical protein
VPCRDAKASYFDVKVQGEVFAHFHTVAVEHHGIMRNWPFDLPWWILCEQSLLCQRKLWACSWLCSLYEILYTDFQDILVLSPTIALCCYNFSTDGSTNARNYGYPVVIL